MKRLATIIATGLVAAIGTSPVHAAQKVKFALDWTFQANHAYFTLAKDNGYFAKEGLDVTIDRGYGSGNTINKVSVGAYDIGFADINLLVDFNKKNPGKKVISIYVVLDKTLNAVVTLAKSGIRTPKDLAGKRIAAPIWDNSRKLFPILAVNNGLDPASVKWLSVKPAIRDGMLLTGQTDAVVAFATSTMLSLGNKGIAEKDIVVMRYSELGVDLYGSGLVVSEKFAAKNSALLKGFIRAVIKGTRDAFADPKKAVASVKQYDSVIKTSIEDKRFALVRDLAVLTASVKANGFSHVDDARLKRTIGFVAKALKIDNPPPPRDIFRGDYLPPADQRKP